MVWDSLFGDGDDLAYQSSWTEEALWASAAGWAYATLPNLKYTNASPDKIKPPAEALASCCHLQASFYHLFRYLA